MNDGSATTTSRCWEIGQVHFWTGALIWALLFCYWLLAMMMMMKMGLGTDDWNGKKGDDFSLLLMFLLCRMNYFLLRDCMRLGEGKRMKFIC
jgi:hypothetical protein